MSPEFSEPTKAQMLASLVKGTGEMSYIGAAVQRSHRFPLHLFVQIENLARMGNTSVSMIINELIECGLEAVKNELPEEVAQEISRVTKEQVERPVKQLREDSGKKPKKANK